MVGCLLNDSTCRIDDQNAVVKSGGVGITFCPGYIIHACFCKSIEISGFIHIPPISEPGIINYEFPQKEKSEKP